jgi:hypothetical protein
MAKVGRKWNMFSSEKVLQVSFLTLLLWSRELTSLQVSYANIQSVPALQRSIVN